MNNKLQELLEEVSADKEVRQNLSKIRALIKDHDVKTDFMSEIKGKEQLLLGTLKSEDAKTRKNAALLLGDIADETENEQITELFMKALYTAYEQEQQLFVKSSYLTALKNYDYRCLLPQLNLRLKELSAYEPAENEKKHISEEIHAIEDLILQMGEIPKHKFTGYQVKSDLILTCNRKHVDTVEAQVKEIVDIDPKYVKTFSAGILLRCDCIEEIQKIRTYHEMLFRIPGLEAVPDDAKLAAELIGKSNLLQFLKERHEITDPDQPFVFRIELKSKMDLAAKSTFVKKLSTGIEQYSKRKLVNNKSNYEVEIRLIETKNQTFNCLVKLYTLEDNRFSYRKESVAASLRPDNAALIIELAKEYMVADARVLDPFCGVATLLIERQKQVKANTSYGIDLYGDAIDKAKINTDAAGQIIHFINKDFFEFEHLYLFDEILTDLPFETGHQSEKEIESIYERFFKKAKQHLTGNGRIILYTHHREMVKQYAAKENYKILKHEIILEKAGTDLFVLEVM